MNIFLQIFLYFDVFIIGVAATLAIRHGREHLRVKKSLPAASIVHSQKETAIPKELKQQLIEESEEEYRKILEHSSSRLSKELEQTVERINATVKKMTEDIVSKELESYKHLFEQYKDSAVREFDGSKEQTAQYQNELKAKLNQEVEQEKQRLLVLIDNKLSDAVMAFLLEAMQHEVDLGAQSDYLLKLLEEHKEEFKQAVGS